MTTLGGVLERGAETLKLALEAVDVIEEGLYGQKKLERCASRMTASMVVLAEMVERTAKETGRHPREVLDQIIEHAVMLFPTIPAKEPGEPKVEDLPSRPVKPGPSPWSDVR